MIDFIHSKCMDDNFVSLGHKSIFDKETYKTHFVEYLLSTFEILLYFNLIQNLNRVKVMNKRILT